jgi:sulfur carrier protein
MPAQGGGEAPVRVLFFFMKITVNGEPIDLSEGERLDALIRRIGKEGERTAVVVNGELVRADLRDGRAVREGDRIDVFALGGGG